MIQINKALSEQKLILTLTELSTIIAPKYLMVMKVDADGDVFKIFLPANVSPHIARYDAFIIDTDVFINMPEGMYTYSVYESASDNESTDESQFGEPVEVGKLKIIGVKSETEIIAPIRKDEYIIYK
jgi:hypothetical protein